MRPFQGVFVFINPHFLFIKICIKSSFEKRGEESAYRADEGVSQNNAKIILSNYSLTIPFFFYQVEIKQKIANRRRKFMN
jgi:hypothetical protein